MGAPDVEGLPWPEGEPGALTAAATPIEGAPEEGDGLDGTVVDAGKDVAQLAESGAKIAATPITLGADVIGSAF